jgi:hypothetical protein
MRTNAFGCALLLAVTVPVAAHQSRLYGINSHSSIASVCGATSRSAGTIRMYLIAGNSCPYYTTIFFTSKFARAPGVSRQSQEDSLLAKTATILEQGLTVVSTRGPGARVLDGVAGREEMVKFQRNISRGYIWEFADNAVSSTVYVTAVVVTLNPFAVEQNSAKATKSVGRLLSSIEIAGGAR